MPQRVDCHFTLIYSTTHICKTCWSQVRPTPDHTCMGVLHSGCHTLLLDVVASAHRPLTLAALDPAAVQRAQHRGWRRKVQKRSSGCCCLPPLLRPPPQPPLAPLLGARGAPAELRGRAGAEARGGPGATARPQPPGARPQPPSARRPGTQLTASSQDCHCSGATWQVTACGAPRQAALGAPAAADAGASLHAGAGEQLAAKAACAARRLRGRGWEDA